MGECHVGFQLVDHVLLHIPREVHRFHQFFMSLRDLSGFSRWLPRRSFVSLASSFASADPLQAHISQSMVHLRTDSFVYKKAILTLRRYFLQFFNYSLVFENHQNGYKYLNGVVLLVVNTTHMRSIFQVRGK